MVTTDLFGFGHYTSSSRVEDYVAGYLGEFAADYDFDDLVAAHRSAVNAALRQNAITLCGDDFYAEVPIPVDAETLIVDAIENVDLDELAAQYNRT